MAERDRRRERRLREIEGELRYCRERAQYYHDRIERLEREQAELSAAGQPSGGEGGAAGGLAELVKSLNPETLKQIGEAMQGIDLQPILTALGAGGGLSGFLSGSGGSGGSGSAPSLGPLSGLLGGGGAQGGNPLDGIAEVMGWLEKNPLKGRRWGAKDVLGVLQLMRSPNVRALISSVGTVAGLLRAGSKAAPLLSALLSGRGKVRAPEEATQPLSAEAPAPASSEPPRVIRFRRPEGPPPVLEPWTGPTGQWQGVPESGGAA
ncbi:MAG: hypothetical protein ACM3XZ_11240 [Betaproteobacteria bacterium]